MINVYLDSRPVVRLEMDPRGGLRMVPLPSLDGRRKTEPGDQAAEWFPDWKTAGKYISLHYR